MECNKNNKSSKTGFSLLEVMVAAGLMAFVILILNQSLSNQLSLTKRVEQSIEVEMIRAHLIERIDCRNSLAACSSPGQEVQLRDKQNNIISNGARLSYGGYKLFGNWSIQSRCGNTGQGVEVRAGLRSRDGSSWVKEPVSDLPLDYNNARYNPVITGEFALCVSDSPQVTGCGTDEVVTGIKRLRDGEYEASCSPVLSGFIENQAIETALLSDRAVNANQIISGKVTRNKFQRPSVNETKLASNAATETEIAGNAILTRHFRNGAVQTIDIGNAQVQNIDLRSGFFDADLWKSNILLQEHIQNNAINTSKLGNNAITTDKISTYAISGSLIANDTITGYEVARDSLYGVNLTDRAILAVDIDDLTLTDDNFGMDSLFGVDIADNALGEWKMSPNIFNNNHFRDRSINFGHLTACGDGELLRYNAYLPGWECSPTDGDYELSFAVLNMTGDASGNNAFNIQILAGSFNAGWQHFRQTNTLPMTAGFEDGFGCDPRQGWQMIFCTMSDDNVVNETMVAETILGRNPYIGFDRDWRIDKNSGWGTAPVPALGNIPASSAASTCWTNDWWNITDTNAGTAGGPPMLKNAITIQLYASCIRTKP